MNFFVASPADPQPRLQGVMKETPLERSCSFPCIGARNFLEFWNSFVRVIFTVMYKRLTILAEFKTTVWLPLHSRAFFPNFSHPYGQTESTTHPKHL